MRQKAKEKPCGGCLPFARRLLFFSVVLGSCQTALRAQDIHIKVLNGHDGRPVTDGCINLSIGSWHGADIVAPTNKDGIVVLHLRGSEITADSACLSGLPSAGHWPDGVDTILITSGGKYVDCLPLWKASPQRRPDQTREMNERVRSYSIKEILQDGVVAENACGKSKAEAKRGELLFFVRRPNWWEILTR